MGARIGKVSAKGDEKYRDAVTFVENNGEDGQQSQDNVTQEFYFAMPLGAIKPPNSDDQVLTVHLETGEEVGIILGRVGSEKFCPPEWFCGLFYQAFSRAWGKCYARYADPDNDPDGNGNDGKFLFRNDEDTRAESKNFEIEAKEDFSLKAKHVKFEGGTMKFDASSKIEISAPNGDISFDAGEIAAAMVKLTQHTHMFNDVTPGGPVPSVTMPPTPTG